MITSDSHNEKSWEVGWARGLCSCSAAGENEAQRRDLPSWVHDQVDSENITSPNNLLYNADSNVLSHVSTTRTLKVGKKERQSNLTFHFKTASKKWNSKAHMTDTRPSFQVDHISWVSEDPFGVVIPMTASLPWVWWSVKGMGQGVRENKGKLSVHDDQPKSAVMLRSCSHHTPLVVYVHSLWSWHRFTSVSSLRRKTPLESFYASWKGIKLTIAAPLSHRGPFLHCTKVVTIFGTLLVQTLTILSRMGEEGPAFTPLAVTGLELTVRCP